MNMVRGVTNRPCAAFAQSIKKCNLSYLLRKSNNKFKKYGSISHQSDSTKVSLHSNLTCIKTNKPFDFLLRTRPVPPISLFNNLLYLVNQNNLHNLVISMHNRMVRADIVPDFVTLNILLHSFCCVQGRPHVSGLGFAVFGGMLKKGYTPNIDTYTFLIKGLFVANKAKNAMYLSEKIVELGIVRYADLVRGLCKTGNTDGATELYKRMISKGVEADSYTYNTIIQCLRDNNEWEKAKDFMNEMMGCAQDLSQPKTEATLPDGVLTVPLLGHQRIALSWMVQKETASLHCFGGILADDPVNL